MTPDFPSPDHARLNRALGLCLGMTPALRAALLALDADNARSLAFVFEQLHADKGRASGSGWRRGFSAGQQS